MAARGDSTQCKLSMEDVTQDLLNADHALLPFSSLTDLGSILSNFLVLMQMRQQDMPCILLSGGGHGDLKVPYLRAALAS